MKEHKTTGADRRTFFKLALTTAAYVAPIVVSFRSSELVRAASGELRRPKNQNDQGDDNDNQ